MYEFTSRVRYSEIDKDGQLKLDALVNYLQDCSTFQSEDLGLGIDYYKEMGCAWVLNYWQIDISRLPRLGDNIIIGTIPYQVRAFMGLRNFYIKDADTDEMIVRANSVWTLIDLKKLTPVRANELMIKSYQVGDKIDMEYTDRKIKLGGESSEGDAVTVVEYMLDTNHHMNNEQYIELALAHVPKDLAIKRIRTEYKSSAYLDDVLLPTVYKTENSIGVSFVKSGSTEPCVICQFEY